MLSIDSFVSVGVPPEQGGALSGRPSGESAPLGADIGPFSEFLEDRVRNLRADGVGTRAASTEAGSTTHVLGAQQGPENLASQWPDGAAFLSSGVSPHNQFPTAVVTMDGATGSPLELHGFAEAARGDTPSPDSAYLSLSVDPTSVQPGRVRIDVAQAATNSSRGVDTLAPGLLLESERVGQLIPGRSEDDRVQPSVRVAHRGAQVEPGPAPSTGLVQDAEIGSVPLGGVAVAKAVEGVASAATAPATSGDGVPATSGDRVLAAPVDRVPTASAERVPTASAEGVHTASADRVSTAADSTSAVSVDSALAASGELASTPIPSSSSSAPPVTDRPVVDVGLRSIAPQVEPAVAVASGPVARIPVDPGEEPLGGPAHIPVPDHTGHGAVGEALSSEPSSTETVTAPTRWTQGPVVPGQAPGAAADHGRVTTVDVTGLPVTTQPAPRAGHGAVPVDLEQIPSGAPVVPVLPASVIPRTRHSAATNRYAEASAPATAQAANGRVGRIVSEAFDLESEATPEAGVELDALDTSDEPNVPRARSDSAPPRPAMRAVVDSVRSDDRPVDTARPLGVTTLGAVSPSATGLSAAAPLAATPGLTSAVTTPLDHTFPPHLVRSARFLVRQGGGEARIRLQPAHLGEVVMTVKVDQGTVTAVLQVDSEAARSWIRTHQDVLRASLGEQGLGLERFTVTERDRRDARDGRDRRDEPTPRRRSTSSGPTATRFEIHV